MQKWLPLALMFCVGGVFGFLVSEKYSSTARIDELTARLAQVEKTAAAPQPALPQRAVPPAQREFTQVSIGNAPIRGSVDAAITIVAFSDFQCPFCQRVHPTLERLLSTYPDRVRLVFKHNPLPMHPDAPLAHRASIAAAEQGHFWEMHDLIFSDIRNLSREQLMTYARDLDFDIPKFTSDLDSERVAGLLREDMAQSDALGVTGTPTFFINGKRLSGAQPFENFQALIDRELEQLDS